MKIYWSKLLSGAAGTALVAVLSMSVALVPRPAHAQWACTNCSTWITQLVQYAEEAETDLNTANSYAQEIQMYNNMVQQGLALPGQVWGNVQADLNSLNSISASGTNIGYATQNLSNQFSSSFPNFQQYLAKPQTATQTSNDLQTWLQQANDASRTSLQVSAQQATDMGTTEAANMTTAQQHSASAAGQMQAIQAGNEFAQQQVQQLQKLRQLIMAQMNMQSEALASQARQQAADKAAYLQGHVDASKISIDGTTQTAGPTGMSSD